MNLLQRIIYMPWRRNFLVCYLNYGGTIFNFYSSIKIVAVVTLLNSNISTPLCRLIKTINMSRKESKTKGMLDKMVGFGSVGKSKSRYPPGQLQRPSSVGKIFECLYKQYMLYYDFCPIYPISILASRLIIYLKVISTMLTMNTGTLIKCLSTRLSQSSIRC